MRVITNRSSGEMGRLIANALAAKGHEVTLLEGSVSTLTPLDRSVSQKKFFFYHELELGLVRELRRGHHIMIHAAAVSDFSMIKPFKGKLSSGHNLTLELTPTKKLVDLIKKNAPKIFLIGFKLETKLTRVFILERTKELIQHAGCDMVIANSQNNGQYKAFLIGPDSHMSKIISGKPQLVKALVSLIDKNIL